MNVRLQFVHLPVIDGTREGLRQWIENKFMDMERYGHLDMQFVCTTEVSRSNHHEPLFDCHLKIKASWLSKEIFVRAKSWDFLTSAYECCDSAKDQLNRQTRKLRSTRKHNNRHYHMAA